MNGKKHAKPSSALTSVILWKQGNSAKNPVKDRTAKMAKLLRRRREGEQEEAL